MTNILILGNGFDLAHHLPTKYDDFLGFSQRLLYVYTLSTSCKLSEYITHHLDTWTDGSEYLKDQLISIFDRRITNTFYAVAKVDEKMDAFRNLIVNNVWFHYFVTISTTSTTRPEKLIRGENWIDFESEISFVVQHLDTNFEDIEERIFVENILNQLVSQTSKGSTKNLAYFNDLKLLEFYRTCRTHCKDVIKDDSIKLRSLRDHLYNDLEDLISAFDFYLTEFVEKIPIKEKVSFVEKADPSYVISFNYTKTFEKQYPLIASHGTILPHVARICHVHGTISEQDETADTINCLESNIVIGIDEYLETPEDQAKRTNFAVFKKFIQRIRKQNDLEYVDWLEEVEKHNPKDTPIAVYIFGHSLNITDKEILEPFLKSDNTYLHIYARDKASEGSLVSNLITIIGREAVIKKSKAGEIVFERSSR